MSCIRCWRSGFMDGKSTLNRMELTPAGCALAERYHKITYSAEAIDVLLVEIFLEAHRKPPTEIVLDLDATDTPLHGRQEGRFFHGYYNHYCYLPLYVFCGDHLLCARLRPSNQDPSAGSPEEVARIVAQIEGKENPRYVVTSLAPEQGPAQRLYEQLYCARGEMENRLEMCRCAPIVLLPG